MSRDPWETSDSDPIADIKAYMEKTKAQVTPPPGPTIISPDTYDKHREFIQRLQLHGARIIKIE